MGGEDVRCYVTRSDLPLIVATIACCLCFLVYGASAASLGAALPSLADHFHRSTAQLGVFFTARGVGYTIGTLGSAYILEYSSVTMSKEMMSCIAILLTGIATAVINGVDNYAIAVLCFVIQGLGFGGIDTMANCALPEMWGERVQPWMQGMQACFGIGAILGPAIISASDYHAAFTTITVCSFIPLVALLAYNTSHSLQTKILGIPHHFQLFKDDESRHAETKLELQDEIQEIELNQLPGATAIDGASSTEKESEKDEGLKDNDQKPTAPLYLKLIVASFFFIYVGAEVGFAGWVPTYAIDENITTDHSRAASLSSIFWAALTAGRLLAIVLAVYFSPTTLIRFQLSLAFISCLLSVAIMTISYSVASFVCAFVGFALSSMFPVMLTLIDSYGFKTESSTTTIVIVGATLGESAVPVLIGWFMVVGGPPAMPWSVFLSVIVLVLIYLAVHEISHSLLRFGRIVLSDDAFESITNPLSEKADIHKEQSIQELP